MNQCSIQILISPCFLCKKQALQLTKYNCIEQSILICEECNNLIREQTENSLFHLSQNYLIDIKYNQKIQIFFGSNNQFYKLSQQTCQLCYQNQICCKVCTNEHYFCLQCAKFYIQSSIQKRQIKCPREDCDQQIDSFMIFQFVLKKQLRLWSAIRYNMFCPNNSCRNIIKIFPQKQISSQIIQIDEKHSQCLSCKEFICNNCWTQFKGIYQKHARICNSEKFKTYLLQQYLIENQVTQCPKCRFHSESSCQKTKKKIQQCQLCQTRYCLVCHSGDVQLLPKDVDTNGCFNCNYKYFSEQNSCKAKLQKILKHKFYIPFFISKLFTLIMIILFIPFQQFMQVGGYVNHYAERLFSTKDISNKRYYLCCCGPLIAIMIIVATFLAYVVLFVPLFIINFKDRFQNEML